MSVVLTGIDGSGKSTVAARLRERDGVAVVHAIRAHEDPLSPYAALSRHLAAASAVADRLGRAPLKIATLYLQLCLYPPQEQAARAGARTVVADRHPLVDPMVYLPLYARMRDTADPGTDAAQWWAGQPEETATTVRTWLTECTGGDDVWALGLRLLDLAALALPQLLAELTRLFPVPAPQRVVLLDLPVEEALVRIKGRTPAAELHESAGALTAIATAYDRVLTWLATSVPVVRIDCAARTRDDVTDEVARAL